MRVAVLALTIALVAGHQVNFAPQFAAGLTYVYQYEAWLLGGLPEEGLGRAGVKVKSMVQIAGGNEQNTYQLKLVDPEISEYSGVWPKDPFVKTPKLTAALAAQLQAPIQFEYVDNVVGKVFAPAGVSATVLNVFRGILNILQLNIKKTQNIYELQEAGSQGMCNTRYTISEDLKAERIQLSKSKNLNQCQDRIMRDVGLAYMEKCAECEKDGKMLTGTASYEYIIKPTATGGLILDAKVNEIHRFSAAKDVSTAVEMQAKQKLTFIDIKAAVEAAAAGPFIHRGSVQFEFAPEMLRTPLQLIAVTNVAAQVVDILDHLVRYNVAEVHHDAPLKFVELVHLLREATRENIEAIWAQHKTRAEYRRWIVEALPAVGTPLTLRFLKEKFIAEDITIPEAIPILLAAVHMVIPDAETLMIVEELAQNPRVQRYPGLRNIAMLGYGTLVAKFCAAKPTCSADLVKNFHQKATDAAAKGDVEQLIVLLKVLGNAGHPASIKTITKLLPGLGAAAASLPLRAHVEAALALRNIAKKEPKMVQDLALALFKEQDAHPEVRMLAVIAIFETRPAMGLVMALADALNAEKSLQVASFAYSHMKALTRSTAPDFAAVAAACNVAITRLSPQMDRLSFRYSRALYLDRYFSPLMAGAAASAFYINDASSILPRAVVAKARIYLAGAAADAMEFGIRTEGLQEALLKIPAAAENVDRITKMRRAIQALSDWRAAPNSQPLASMYFKLFGQEVAFTNIEEAIAIATGPLREFGMAAFKALQAGFNAQYAMPMLLAEVRRILPTAVGLPMEISLYSAAVATANVQVKAAITPAMPEAFDIRHLLKADVRLEATIAPSAAVHTFAVMGVNTEFIQAAVMARAKVNAIVPAKMAVRINIAEGNFKLEMLPVTAPAHVAKATFVTFAVARHIADAAERITPIPARPAALTSAQSTSRQSASLAGSASKSSEIVYPEELAHMKAAVGAPAAPFREAFCAQALGLQACLQIESENAAFLGGDRVLFYVLGMHVAKAVVTPAEGEAVQRLEMEVQLGAAAAQKIIREISASEEDAVVAVPALKKLQKILAPGVKARASSSSSSSRSSSSRARSSSASSSRSLSSSRSSSRSSSSRQSMAEVFAHRFKKNHQKQNAASQATSQARVSASKSSAASFEAINQQTKIVGSGAAPIAIILLGAVRANQKMAGYQITAYLDKPTASVRIAAANLDAADKWKICAQAAVLSVHKASAKFAWGADCKEYDAMFTAETGLMGADPAARLRASWVRLPRVPYAAMAYKYIPAAVSMAGLTAVQAQNSEKQISLTLVATSESTFDFFMKSPKETMYKKAIQIPIAVPFKEAGLIPFDDSIANKIHLLFTKATAAQCSMKRDMLTTFNNRKYKNEMPLSCYQVLAQDCTPELKFMVLLKKDLTAEQNHLNVKIADIDIDLYPMGNEILAKVNGLGIPIANLPYQHPSGTIQIKQKGEGLALYAPSHGLHEVYFDINAWKVKVADWMKGQTCGLCGKADGEVRQEYRTPNGRVTKSAVSYAHSWVLPAESCRDTTECYMKLESVKLEKQMVVHGVASKCYSVEPVLRCLPGCMAVRTTPVTVGFHCLPAESPLNRAGLANIYEKSVDLRATTEAHVACRCTAQCA